MGETAGFSLLFPVSPPCLYVSLLGKKLAVSLPIAVSVVSLTFSCSSASQEAGVEVDPLGDLNTESERKLGQLVAEKYLITPLPNHKNLFFQFNLFFLSFLI